MREPGALTYTGEQRERGLRTRHTCGTGRLSQGRTGERPGRGTGLGRAGLSGADRRAGGRGLSGAGQAPQALLGHLHLQQEPQVEMRGRMRSSQTWS